MAYTAFETAANEAYTQVKSYCRHAARADGEFTSGTVPSLVQVEGWITVSYYWVRGLLNRYGYSATQTNINILGILMELNVLDAAAKIELSLPAESTTGEPNQRFIEFNERRKELMNMIADGTFSAMGAVMSSSAARTPLLSGISKSRKDILESDDDATQHRIRRNLFQSPGTRDATSEQDWQL